MLFYINLNDFVSIDEVTSVSSIYTPRIEVNNVGLSNIILSVLNRFL